MYPQHEQKLFWKFQLNLLSKFILAELPWRPRTTIGYTETSKQLCFRTLNHLDNLNVRTLEPWKISFLNIFWEEHKWTHPPTDGRLYSISKLGTTCSLPPEKTCTLASILLEMFLHLGKTKWDFECIIHHKTMINFHIICTCNLLHFKYRHVESIFPCHGMVNSVCYEQMKFCLYMYNGMTTASFFLSFFSIFDTALFSLIFSYRKCGNTWALHCFKVKSFYEVRLQWQQICRN